VIYSGIAFSPSSKSFGTTFGTTFGTPHVIFSNDRLNRRYDITLGAFVRTALFCHAVVLSATRKRAPDVLGALFEVHFRISFTSLKETAS